MGIGIRLAVSVLFIVEVLLLISVKGLDGMDFGLSVLASLVAALIAGLFGYSLRGVHFKKALMSAPEKYVQHLDKLISSAANEGTPSIAVNARAIVSTRDDLQGSLTALSKLLNSDIDRLKEIIERDKNLDALLEVAQVLEKKWPAKKDQIRIELNKLISEIGLKEIA